MTTPAEPQVGQGQDTGYRRCEGCPRCQDQNAPWCSIPHPEYGNLHPVCQHCRHCVLRGSHADDTSDLTPSLAKDS